MPGKVRPINPRDARMKKRWLLLVFVLLAVGGVALAVWANRPQPGVTWENIAKLRPGITEAEVEVLLDGPGEPVGNKERVKSWQNERPMEGSVVVEFSRSGVVLSVRSNPPPGAHLPRWRRWIFGEP
jgi:hypothetical protein